jgi:hypothetical protein
MSGAMEIPYQHTTRYTKKNGEVITKTYNYTRLIKNRSRGPTVASYDAETIRLVKLHYAEHSSIVLAASTFNKSQYHIKQILKIVVVVPDAHGIDDDDDPDFIAPSVSNFPNDDTVLETIDIVD